MYEYVENESKNSKIIYPNYKNIESVDYSNYMIFEVKGLIDLKNTYEFEQVEQESKKKCLICGKRNIVTEKFKSIYSIDIKNWKEENRTIISSVKEKLQKLFYDEDREDKYYNPNEINNIIKVLEAKKNLQKRELLNEKIDKKIKKIQYELENGEEKAKKGKKFTEILFEKLLEKHEKSKNIGYNIKQSHEIDKASYPAGYIFEKLTAYRIYDLVKDNPKIIGMETSLKAYFTDEKKPNHIIDELDIVLLTDIGKIINFECESGGMKGDNAKSYNYTTYRLVGVFGMSILLSPLYEAEKEKYIWVN